MMNEPFVFIKPHVSRCPAVVQFVKKRLAAFGVEWLYEFSVTGSQIAAGGLVDKHYAVNAHAGMAEDVHALFISEEGKAHFQALVGESWQDAVDSGRLFSGWQYMQQHSLTATAMAALWRTMDAHKVAGGYYVGVLPDHKGYVLNGFYPSVREAYTRDDVSLDCGILRFNEVKLNWRAFRHHVIGSTNPAQADVDSIRGEMFQRAKEYGVDVSISDNVIHASASPFEALIEKINWLGDNLKNDPLLDALQELGVTKKQIQTWYYDNPAVAMDGQQETLVDVLEDKNSSDVLALVKKYFL